MPPPTGRPGELRPGSPGMSTTKTSRVRAMAATHDSIVAAASAPPSIITTGGRSERAHGDEDSRRPQHSGEGAQFVTKAPCGEKSSGCALDVLFVRRGTGSRT